VVTPSLHIVACREMDRKTGVVTSRPKAWTGVLKAEPFYFDVEDPTEPIEPGNTLKGTVIDDDGNPVSGAFVHVAETVPNVGNVSGRGQQVADQVLTDEYGMFSITRLNTNGEHTLSVSSRNHSSFTQSVPAFHLLKEPLPRYEITLKRQQTVRGRIVDEDGEPVSDVRVSSQSYSNHDGEFSVMVKPDTDDLGLRLWRHGFAPRSVNVPKSDFLNVVLYSERSQTVHCRAMFADGTPVSNCKLEYQVRRNTHSDAVSFRLESETDREGRYELVLPDRDRYSASVRATEQVESGHRHQWDAEVTSLSLEDVPHDIIFENRGKILVGLPGIHALPTECGGFHLYCSAEETHWNVPAELPAGKSGFLIDNLQPGKYRFTLRTKKLGYEWKQTVEVPNQSPWRASVRFKIDQIELGSLKTHVVMPDGKTPAANISVAVWKHGTNKSGMTDASGDLLIEGLPPGTYWGTPLAEGFAPVRVELGRVEARKCLAASEIRLKRHDEEFGWFEGTLTYDDGTPVGNAVYTGGDSWPNVSANSLRPVNPTDGSFQFEFRKGWQESRFAVSSLWDEQSQMRYIPIESLPTVVVPVDIRPGTTVHRDLVIRRRDRPVELEVHFDDGAGMRVSAVVEQEHCSWVQVPRSELPFFAVELASPVVFDSLPNGNCAVVAQSNDYFGTARATFKNDREQIRFNTSETGSILVSVAEFGNDPLMHLGLEVSADVAGMKIPVCTHNKGLQGWPNSTHSIMHLIGNGRMKINGLGAGSYTVAITDGDQRVSAEVVVQVNQVTPLTFVRSDAGVIQQK